MRRALLRVPILAAALAAAAPPARAQIVAYVGVPGDTAVGALTGIETLVDVHVSKGLFNPIQSARTLTFFFDTAKAQLLGVVAVPGDTVLATTPGVGSLTVVDSNASFGFDVTAYRLRFVLKTGVTDGTYLWIRGDSAAVQSFGEQPVLGSIGRVCHATFLWGDVDGSGAVDSRDALITLSAAVGLPVNGFNLAVGDVDLDGFVSSRDALLMLSAAIALPIGIPNRVNVADPDACPGLSAPGDSVAFQRSPVGLEALGGQALTPAAVPGATSTASDAQPRLAADGRTIVYVCPGSGGTQICRVDADTGGVVRLTFDSLGTSGSPDWSPAGDSIVWLRAGTIWKMRADGTGQTFVGSGIGAYDVKWGRSGTTFGYAATADGGLHVVNTDGTGNTLVSTGFTDVRTIRWSPAGDSLAFGRASDPRLWVVPTAGGAPAIVLGLTGSLLVGDWGSQGILFGYSTALYGGAGAPSLWVIRGVSGAIFRLTTAPANDTDQSPAWRRSP